MPNELSLSCISSLENIFKEGIYDCRIDENERIKILNQTNIMSLFVRNSMKYFYNNYINCSFGYDNIKPISCSGINNNGGIGLTIIDNLDTLYLMGLKEEYNYSYEWVKSNFNESFLSNITISFSHLVNNILGGLMSIYTLTFQNIYKEKSIMIGNHIKKIMNNHIFPPELVFLNNNTGESFDLISTKTATTCQLELRYLSRLSNDISFDRIGTKIYSIFTEHSSKGLVADTIKSESRLRGNIHYTNFYDYQLKLFLMGSDKEAVNFINFRQFYQCLKEQKKE